MAKGFKGGNWLLDTNEMLQLIDGFLIGSWQIEWDWNKEKLYAYQQDNYSIKPFLTPRATPGNPASM